MLQQAQRATETILDQAVTINSIIAPQHFSVMPSVTLLVKAAIGESIVGQYHQVTPALNGARFGYTLDSYDGFELEPNEECNIKGPHYAMIVSYEQTRLDFNG